MNSLLTLRIPIPHLYSSYGYSCGYSIIKYCLRPIALLSSSATHVGIEKNALAFTTPPRGHQESNTHTHIYVHCSLAALRSLVLFRPSQYTMPAVQSREVTKTFSIPPCVQYPASTKRKKTKNHHPRYLKKKQACGVGTNGGAKGS